MIKLRILRWEDHPELAGWAELNRSFKRGGQRVREETGDVMVEARGWNEAGILGQLLEAGRDKERSSSLDPEGELLCQHLNFTPVKLMSYLWDPTW